jgi:integrase
LRLRWADVDEKRGILTIGADGDTKNRKPREIEINPSLAAHLASMKARRQPDSVWLFPSPRRGKEDRPAKSFRESLRIARAAAKIPTFGFHDCRRFFATMSIQAGVDIQTVARWLGHQDGGMLVAKTYADVLDEHRKRMAAKLTFSDTKP